MRMVDQEKNGRVVRAGSRVELAYSLSMTDGVEIDTASREEPFLFSVGDGSLIAGLEGLLMGLSAGAREHFLVAAEDAFGVREPDQIHTLARDSFDGSQELEPGVVLSFETPSGEQIPATVVEIREQEVLVDFNHPLAGRDLQFEIEIVSVGEGDHAN